MSRRGDPERIYQSQRAATIERLVSAGVRRDVAELRMAAYEAERGRPADGMAWEAAFRELASPPDRRERP